MNIEAILADPDNAELPKEEDVVACATAIRDHAIAETDIELSDFILSRGVAYFNRLQDEQSFLAMQSMTNAIGERAFMKLILCTEYKKWYLRMKAYLDDAQIRNHSAMQAKANSEQSIKPY